MEPALRLRDHPRRPPSVGRAHPGRRRGGAPLPGRVAEHPRPHRLPPRGPGALGVPDPSPALLAELEGPPAGPVVEVFPDVVPVLDRLRDRGVRMSVVSDNWAGMEASFAELGIGHYFAGYAVSEVLGCRKPDPRMYAHGAGLIGLPPGECLFVDDDPELVAAARDLGYHGFALDRATTTLDAVLPLAGLTA